MFTKAFFQKGIHSFQKDALLFVFSSEFKGVMFTMAGHFFKMNAMLLIISLSFEFCF